MSEICLLDCDLRFDRFGLTAQNEINNEIMKIHINSIKK